MRLVYQMAADKQLRGPQRIKQISYFLKIQRSSQIIYTLIKNHGSDVKRRRSFVINLWIENYKLNNLRKVKFKHHSQMLYVSKLTLLFTF